MRKIFIGMLFVFLNFNLTVNGMVIGLLPNFVGFILVYVGLGEISADSRIFADTRPWAIAATVYSFVLYVLDLFGLASQELLIIILGLIQGGLSIYISYKIIMGIKEVEAARGADLQSDGLYKIWLPLVVLSLSVYALIILPPVMVIATIAALVLNVIFLIRFSRTANAYEGMAGI